MGDQMVAVIRSSDNSTLSVTLLDGSRQYTLKPNSVSVTHGPRQSAIASRSRPMHAHEGTVNHCDSSTQAVDDTYASVYRLAHCNCVPTSPEFQLPEFPPQKAEICPGQGNFQVGGNGSGEINYSPTRSNNFKGGICWSDRGSVFAHRPVVEPDAFTSSLRKYPNKSPDRTAEVFERLVNYTHSKQSKLKSSRYKANYDDESPTRDNSRKCDIDRRPFERQYNDVRYVKEQTRKSRNFGADYPHNHTACPCIKERSDYPYDYKFLGPELLIKKSIDSETQAAIEMISKEVSTVPRKIPSMRNVAVPLSPSPSRSATEQTKSTQSQKSLDRILNTKKSAQISFSSVDLTTEKVVKDCTRSKSQVEMKENYLKDGDVDNVVHELTSSEAVDSLRCDIIKKLKQIYTANRNDYIKVKLGKCVKDQISSEIDLKNLPRELSDELIWKIKKYDILNSYPCKMAKDSRLIDKGKDLCVDNVIKEWMKDIPLKPKDYLGENVKKDQLLNSVTNKIKSTVMDKLKVWNERTFKKNIIDLIEDIPIAATEHTKRYYFNKLITVLMSSITNIPTKRKTWINPENNSNDFTICNDDKPTNNIDTEEVKQFVKDEIIEFEVKFDLKICSESIEELEIEITDIIMDSLNEIHVGKTNHFKEEVVSTLLALLNISEQQAIYFAHDMVYNLRDFIKDATKFKSQSFLVLNNQCCSKNNQSNNRTDISIDAINEGDIEANLNWYTKQIIQQINEWLSDFKVLNLTDSCTKVVINDLAEDIVDRHKYLELNPNSRGTDEDELEHLKYQIFKWINKIVSVDNLEAISHAPELMTRIQNIPVPMLIKTNSVNGSKNGRSTDQSAELIIKKSRQQFSKCSNTCSGTTDSANSREGIRNQNTQSNLLAQDQSTITMQSEILKSNELKSTSTQSGSVQTKVDCCANASQDKRSDSLTIPSKSSVPINFKIDLINQEYDMYLSEWIQKIPIAECPNIADKARQGIYNGVWKAIAKLKMNPTATKNSAYYKDLFEDEIEELLDCLPLNPELDQQIICLKADIVSKTCEFNQKMLEKVSTYKQQLMENIANNLPRKTVDFTGEDVAKTFEEIMKLHLAEYFILYTKYKEADKIKANVFKKKLLHEIEDLVNGIKSYYGKELKDINTNRYIESVMIALERVPQPNNETINKEADEIILALEVEQWFTDLPFIPNEEHQELLARRKYRDALAKKLFDIENNLAQNGNMKEEILNFLKRMPLREPDKMDFMAEELLNRLNNRPKDVLAGSERRRSVAFHEPYNYDEFSQEMPLCSSFCDNPAAKAQVNQSSYMIKDGTRVKDTSFPCRGQYVQDRNESPPPRDLRSFRNIPNDYMETAREPDAGEQWYTLEESRAPTVLRGPDTSKPLCCKTNDQFASSRTYISNERSGVPEANIPRFSQLRGQTRMPIIPESSPQPSVSSRSTIRKSDSPCNEYISQGPQTRYIESPQSTSRTPCQKTESTRPVSSYRSGEVPTPEDISRRPPLGYSTPQETSPLSDKRPSRKTRDLERSRREAARKKLDLDTESDDDDEMMKCRCFEKLKRLRRRPPCFPYDDFAECMPRFPMGYPYPCFW